MISLLFASELITFYLKNDVHLIRILPNSKDPANTSWYLKGTALTQEQTLDWIKNENGNIGCCCDNIIDFDCDSKPRGTISENLEYYRQFKTAVVFSPHGFHVFYKMEKPKPLDAPSSLKLFLESIRIGRMYFLLPPSKVNGKGYWPLDNFAQGIQKI